jgi:isoquinoline 1-oxidoreductase alpha subunit
MGLPRRRRPSAEEQEACVTLFSFTLNGKPTSVDCDGTTRVLWVLRDLMGLTGTKYGCGISLCWACAILVNGQAAKSCDLEIKEMQGKTIVTVEGLANLPNGKKLQDAWVAEQVPQCGYCQSGFLCRATQLLNEKPKPSAGDAAGLPNVCVCGTYQRAQKAILRASGQ